MSESDSLEMVEIIEAFGELPSTLDEKVEENDKYSKSTDTSFLNKLLNHNIFSREEESKLAYHMVDCYNNIIPVIKSTPYIIPILEKIVSEEHMEIVDKNKLRTKVKNFQSKWDEIKEIKSKLNGNKKKYNQYMQELEAKKDEIKNVQLEDYLRQYFTSISNQFIKLMEETLQTKNGIPQFNISHTELKLLYKDFCNIYKEYKSGVDSFVEHNLKLVNSRVLKYNPNQNIKSDLFQEGIFGLLRAINGFDPKRGFKFSSYAINWIDQSIQRYLDQYVKLIDLPVYVSEKIRKVWNASKELETQLNRRPTNSEIASAINMTEEEIKNLILLPKAVPNVRILKGDDNDSEVEFTDFIGDDKYSPDKIVEGRITREDMNSLLQRKLTPKEEMVIRYRFGLGCDDHTLEEIGEEWGVSRERIRQIEEKALKKLRLKIPKYYKELC